MQAKNPPILQYVCLALLFALASAYQVRSALTRVNSMLYDASTEDRYATLFYAQYDPATHRLSYVNAGHCPPIFVRSAANNGSKNGPKNNNVDRLDKAGGTVVGLLPECAYEQAEVCLTPGDLLV